LGRDKDEKLDVYDARVGGGFPEGETPPCGGEACAGPIAGPPAFPGAASSSFSGPGNAKPRPACRRGFARKHSKCVKRKHNHRARAAKRNRGVSR
jgi:hypothetical protein